MIELIIALVLWGFLHSLFASNRMKDLLQRVFGHATGRVYRLTYNLFAVLLFIPVVWILRTMPDRVLYIVTGPWRDWMLAGQILGVLLLAAGLVQTDPYSFAGLRQLVESQPQAGRLVSGGLYRYVRHPLYSAGLLILWLSPFMSLNLLALFLGLTVYIVIGAGFEERRLLQEFGAEYAGYKSRTPMFVPGLRIKM